jgi:hypothetical protein
MFALSEAQPTPHRLNKEASSMRLINFCLLLVAAVLFCAALYAKPEYAKKESKACSYCHTQGKELTDTGKCYERTKKLTNCPTPEPKPPKEPSPPAVTKAKPKTVLRPPTRFLTPAR